MDFRILGPLEVCAATGPLHLGRPKRRALLALLLLHPNEVVTSDRLIEELWGEDPPETATKALQVLVADLRKLLEPERGRGQPGRVLLTRPSGYLLQLESEQLDLARFERLLAEARRALAADDLATGRARLGEALSLWRGQPLADLAYEPFAQAEIARLEELRMGALEERIEADLALGCHADVVGELEALVAAHPLRERLRRALMLALYRSARQAEALEAYQDARRALTEELGIEPSRELRELEQAILVQDRSLDLESPGNVTAAMRDDAGGTFVGRETELAELRAGLDATIAGSGCLYLLVGEPGIGKSRLAEELGAHARAQGARVLVGRCWEAGGAPAFWPWVQSLRAYVRESDAAALRSQLGAGAADLANILPDLRQRFPDLPAPAALESEGARFRLFDATAEFLRSASKSQPIVLVLDDLHAADASSLLLLRFLARELGSMRLLLLGIYRDVDPVPGQPLIEMLVELAREPVTRALSLDGLSEREVGRFVELAGSEIASPELVAALHDETEGNPLFVEEIVRLVSVEGVQLESPCDLAVAVPQSVHDVIARRLAHLSDECNRLLLLASVLGRAFTLEALARVSDVAEDELVDLLDEAIAVRVVSEVAGAPGRLRFAHVLTRDTLYEGLSAVRRVRLHGLAVEALEGLYGEDPGPHLAELAHHSMAGRKPDKGLHYAQRAGDRALTLLAYEEAARLYETALEALDLLHRGQESARCELLLSLGEAESLAGNTPSAKNAFVDAADIARRLGSAHELARAAAGYAGHNVWGRAGSDDLLVPLLEEGLAALAEEDVEPRARLLARLAGALRDEPSRDRRDKLSAKAVELARRTCDSAGLAYALDGRAAAIFAPDTVSDGLALGNEICEVAERGGNAEHVAAGLLWRVIAKLQVGDVSRAEVDLAAADRIGRQLRQPALLWEVRGTKAMLALAAGRLAEAEELAAQAFALGEHAQPEAAIPVYRLQRYALADFRGSVEEYEPEIRELAADYPARPAFRCALALLHARLGGAREAQEALDDLVSDDVAALPFDQEWLYGTSLLAEACALLGDAESAAVLYRLLTPWAGFNVAEVAEGFRGSVARYLGLLAATMGRWEEAEQHFQRAVEMNARMGARPWLAHTQHDYARMLLVRDESPRAHGLIAEALATYRELGMESWTEGIGIGIDLDPRGTPLRERVPEG
jgi:DNA-binding SARP family transcriptional activator